MAGTLVTSFSVAQNATGTAWVITDTTNYVAAAEVYTLFTARVVTMTKNDGSTVTVPAFPYVGGNGDTLTVTGIDRDYSLSVTMALTRPNPVSGSIYTKTGIYTSTTFIQAFLYSLLQTIAAKPDVVNDPIFQSSLRQLQNESSNAATANSYNDQNAAQAALNRGYNIMNNSTIFF